MLLAVKFLKRLSRLVVSVSTKLSAFAVLGSAGLLLLPQDAASRMNAPAPRPPLPAAIEVVPIRQVPLVETLPIEPAVEQVARRSRSKRRRSEPDKAVSRKMSAISPSAAPPDTAKSSAPAPKRDEAAEAQPKADAAQPEPPKPDVWSEAQVIAALRDCVQLLAPIAADVEVSEPVKREQCGVPGPVLLRRIGSGANRVEISPPAMLNCKMVVALHTWVEKNLQPAAQEAFGSPVTRLRNASGYVCRNRVGSLFNGGRLSEHALANAIDISGFVTADGRTIDVARAWGPTVRDEREAQKVAQEAAKNAGPSTDKGKPAGGTVALDRRMSAISPTSAQATKGQRPPAQTAELRKPASGASDAGGGQRSGPAAIAAQREEAAKSPQGQFLRRLHKGACGVFGTVLGPEANEAHRDHFHFDLAHRRHAAFCQ